jgi:hypothetical protein
VIVQRRRTVPLAMGVSPMCLERLSFVKTFPAVRTRKSFIERCRSSAGTATTTRGRGGGVIFAVTAVGALDADVTAEHGRFSGRGAVATG